MNVVRKRPDQVSIERIGEEILRQTKGDVSINGLSFLPRTMMKLSMRYPEMRTQLFRLIDVYPTLHGPYESFDHLQEYLGNGEGIPKLVQSLLNLGGSTKLTQRLVARILAKNLKEVAGTFIAGVTAEDVTVTAARYWARGVSSTIDVLGEKTLTVAEGRVYRDRIVELVQSLLAYPFSESEPPSDVFGIVPVRSVSIKPTALTAHYNSLQGEVGRREAILAVESILGLVLEGTVICYFDMEDHDVKDITLEMIETIARDPKYATVHVGVVLQAYLREAESDVKRMIELSRERIRRGWTPLCVRLVKGAYVDAEIVKADSESWESAVQPTKEASDASFERCADLLLDAANEIRPAFGSHNLRSIAYVIAGAQVRGLADSAFEIQMLYGMAEPLTFAVRSILPRVRLYLPMGELIPGMSYLVRRLLENTSNESFLRQGFVERGSKEIAQLLRPPREHLQSSGRTSGDETEHKGHGSDPLPRSLASPYRHEASLRFYDGRERERFGTVLSALGAGGLPGLLGQSDRAHSLVPVVIDGEEIETAMQMESVNPAHPDQIVASSSSAGSAEVSAALDSAWAAYGSWSRTPPVERAHILIKAASWLRQHRREIAALEILEVGKPWREADGDITEAIDFLEFYARALGELERDGALISPMGETNRQRLRPRGVTVVISPWNFPLAIPLGMVAAALVCGNTVVLKPAEQSPATAYSIVRAFRAAGLPPGVLNFLPGIGETVGPELVESPLVSTIAFTGSLAVGLQILRSAAVVPPGQGDLKRVVAELGGKNPIVVDSDADMDQVIPAVLYSAFGFAGQKCSAASRLIVHQNRFAEVQDRLAKAMETLVVGDPRDSSVTVGPVIDADARRRIEEMVRTARKETPTFSIPNFDGEGYFVPPTLVSEPSIDAAIWRDEIFGPVLAMKSASSLEEAVAMANDSSYALTAGLFSRSPEAIAYGTAEIQAGNLYINRHITGAVPGRQPFGGYRLSGLGSKAGGREYLHYFLNTTVVTENTLRQGFVPDIL